MTTEQQFDLVLREWVETFMRRSMSEFRAAMQDSHLSLPQFGTLMHLYHGGACGISAMGEHLGVTPAAASQMIERLVKSGLIERVENRKDRRVKNLTLTRKGRALIKKGIEARLPWMQGLTSELSAQQQASIVEALQALTEAAAQLEPEAALPTRQTR